MMLDRAEDLAPTLESYRRQDVSRCGPLQRGWRAGFPPRGAEIGQLFRWPECWEAAAIPFGGSAAAVA
jgi:hypothetical protein